MKGFYSGKQEPEQGWSGHSPYLAALAAALAAAAGDTAPGEIKGDRILRREWRRDGRCISLCLPVCYFIFFVICRGICPFTHSSSILSLSLHLLYVLRSPSIHPPASSLSICRLVDKTDKWMGECMHGYMARWEDGGRNEWMITHNLSLSYPLCTLLPISLPTLSYIPLSIYQYLTCPPAHLPINLSSGLPVCLFIHFSHAPTHAPMQPSMHAPMYPHTHSSKHLCSFLPA